MPIDARNGRARASSGDNPNEVVSTTIDSNASPFGFSRNSTMRPALSTFIKPNRNDRNGDVGIRLEVPLKKLSVIHAIQVVAGKNQQRVDPPVANVRQHLTHRVRGPLKPFAAFRSLLGGQHFDESVREWREAIRGSDVPIERC